MPNRYKNLKIVEKSRNSEFRKLLFNSEFFEQNEIKIISHILSKYNKIDFTQSITRQQAEYYNHKLKSTRE